MTGHAALKKLFLPEIYEEAFFYVISLIIFDGSYVGLKRIEQ